MKRLEIPVSAYDDHPDPDLIGVKSILILRNPAIRGRWYSAEQIWPNRESEGKALRGLRKAAGLTMHNLSMATGYSVAAISAVELDAPNASARVRDAMTDALADGCLECLRMDPDPCPEHAASLEEERKRTGEDE